MQTLGGAGRFFYGLIQRRSLWHTCTHIVSRSCPSDGTGGSPHDAALTPTTTTGECCCLSSSTLWRSSTSLSACSPEPPHATMATTELHISDGPDRAELLKSLANLASEVSASEGAFDAVIDQMEPTAKVPSWLWKGTSTQVFYGGLCFAGTCRLDKRALHNAYSS
jgi:hypothetical protein